MRDQLRRSPFGWVVLLLCALYGVLSVFTVIVSIRYYGMMKAPGWDARDRRRLDRHERRTRWSGGH